MVPAMSNKTLVMAGALLFAAAGLTSCNKKSDAGAAAPGAAAPQAGSLLVEDVKIGEGTVATKGKTVSVHYTGVLTNGTKFDSSLDRGQPIVFPLGTGMVIKGWDQGVEGMKVGGKRKLTIPPDLAYGAKGTPGGPIPPNATLVFDVELVDVK
jgi:FKBP-type peptidyl-prolyl cis-trans isomerase